MQINISGYKRELLYRKAQGKMHQEAYVNKIQSFIGVAVDTNKFLDLEATDRIINELKAREIKSKQRVDISNYKDLIFFIKEKVGHSFFYLLIDEEWKFCGAYKSTKPLSEKYNFDKLCSDEIRITSCDLSFQIQIDYEHSEIECEYIEYK
ncbi:MULTISPECIES: hypothetical protein [Enterobacterales]|uniref:hypothetical protein n=1 Tax=Enterobacterales TaxID=91347 RepID=UPI002ED7E305